MDDVFWTAEYMNAYDLNSQLSAVRAGLDMALATAWRMGHVHPHMAWPDCRRSGRSMTASTPPTARPGLGLCHSTRSLVSSTASTIVATSWSQTSLTRGEPPRSEGSTRTAWHNQSHRSSGPCAVHWPFLDRVRIGQSSFAEMSPPSPVVTKSWASPGRLIGVLRRAKSRRPRRKRRKRVTTPVRTLT